MSREDEMNRKCFTFIWKVENADLWWLPVEIESPTFVVEEIHTNMKLNLYFSVPDKYRCSQLWLEHLDDKDGGNIEVDCEIAFLSNNTVLHSAEMKKISLGNRKGISFFGFPSRFEVYYIRRSVFLSQDTLTVRCRMWKSSGEFSKNGQCIGHTRIPVETRSFLWNIPKFPFISDFKRTYYIASFRNCAPLMSLEIFLKDLPDCKEALCLKIILSDKCIKRFSLQLSIVDALNNNVICFPREFFREIDIENQEFTLFYSKLELIEKKRVYLPDNVLSLLGECSFSFGIIEKEIESISSNYSATEKLEKTTRCLEIPNDLSLSKRILMSDFKLLLNDNFLPDVKLKTRNQTYPAHKCILGIRSPVFKAMFSSEMKEKIKDCVDIEDISDETLSHMLRFIYSADVEELDWGRTTELYEAADKYQILNLMDICSCYLKNHLCANNACETLVLADLHQDEALKSFVQDFILKNGQLVINSEEWKRLMEANLKLAAETMCLKFKEEQK